MTHEIHNALVARRRRLRDSDASAYSGLRLVVQRQGLGKAVVSVIYTSVAGQRMAESRLGVITISTAGPGGAPLGAYDVLQRALDSLRSEP